MEYPQDNVEEVQDGTAGARIWVTGGEDVLRGKIEVSGPLADKLLQRKVRAWLVFEEDT